MACVCMCIHNAYFAEVKEKVMLSDDIKSIYLENFTNCVGFETCMCLYDSLLKASCVVHSTKLMVVMCLFNYVQTGNF